MHGGWSVSKSRSWISTKAGCELRQLLPKCDGSRFDRPSASCCSIGLDYSDDLKNYLLARIRYSPCAKSDPFPLVRVLRLKTVPQGLFKHRQLSSAWSFSLEIGPKPGKIATLESANGKSPLGRSAVPCSARSALPSARPIGYPKFSQSHRTVWQEQCIS